VLLAGFFFERSLKDISGSGLSSVPISLSLLSFGIAS
jgi:hypothetical protein